MAIDVNNTYRRYGPMALRRCRKLLRDEEQACDVMHDVFVQLLRNQDRLEDRGLASLVYRVATNLSLNRLRSTKRKPVDSDDELVLRLAVAEGGEGQANARGILDRVFGREPASSATIAVMHLVDGFTLQEVADEVGLSVSGVRKRLRKIRGLAGEVNEPLEMSR